jgi:Flp pilus assembly protein TadG
MMKRSRKGQSLVETSLILAAFLGLLLGIVGSGQSVFVRQTFSERVHLAARWGALNAYQPEAIRNLVLYGTAAPDLGTMPFMGLAASDVIVAAPGCPGTQCRITVAIPRQGIQSTEPAEVGGPATGGVLSKP